MRARIPSVTHAHPADRHRIQIGRPFRWRCNRLPIARHVASHTRLVAPVEEEVAEVVVTIGPRGALVVEEASRGARIGVDGEVVEADVTVDECAIGLRHGDCVVSGEQSVDACDERVVVRDDPG